MKKIFSLIVISLTAIALQAEEALVDISVACVRSEPRHSAELVTQQLMGFPLKIHRNTGVWSEVTTIDGYRGYVINNSLARKDHDAMTIWKDSSRAVYTDLTEGKIYADTLSEKVICDIVPGAILQTEGFEPNSEDYFAKVTLPSGAQGFVEAACLTPIDQWLAQEFDAEKIISYPLANMGSPYLWGGMSAKAMDCSGMTWVAYFLNGRMLRRDASQQALMSDDRLLGWRDLKPGDLMFFGNTETGRVNHVAIYAGDGKYVESSGRVKENSVENSSFDNFLFGISLSEADLVSSLRQQLFN